MTDKDTPISAPDAAGRSPRPAPEHPSAARRPLAAFDFDGTLTVRDSFNAFLAWRTPLARQAAAGLRLAPRLVAYLFDRDRGRLKAAAVGVLLGGIRREDLDADAERFAAEAASRLFRPDALARWEEHRRNGHELVIVTASPEQVVAPFARRLGADRLIGTRLAFDAAGRIEGRFDGANCRGPEKVRRLEAVYGPGVRLEAAYGDTSGDVEMLARADHPFMRLFQGQPR